MNIGFDLHGVIDSNPLIMRDLMRCLIRNNISVYVISGSPKKEILEELFRYGIHYRFHYTSLLSIVDTLKSDNINMWQDEKNRWYCKDEYWWPVKGRFCREYKIDWLFDDCERYKEYLPKTTKFIHIRINQNERQKRQNSQTT